MPNINLIVQYLSVNNPFEGNEEPVHNMGGIPHCIAYPTNDVNTSPDH